MACGPKWDEDEEEAECNFFFAILRKWPLICGLSSNHTSAPRLRDTWQIIYIKPENHFLMTIGVGNLIVDVLVYTALLTPLCNINSETSQTAITLP